MAARVDIGDDLQDDAKTLVQEDEFVGLWKECWQQAFGNHAQVECGCTKPNNEFQELAAPASAATSPDQMQGLIEHLERRCRQKKTTVGGRVSKIALKLRRYANIADLFCDNQPFEVAVVWGCIRFFIEIAAQPSILSTTIGEGVLEAVWYLKRGQTILRHLADKRPRPSDKLFESIRLPVVNLLALSVCVLQRAWEHQRKTGCARLKAAVLKDFKSAHEPKMKQLRQADEELKNALGWAWDAMHSCPNSRSGHAFPRVFSAPTSSSTPDDMRNVLADILTEVRQQVTNRDEQIHEPASGDRVRRAVIQCFQKALEGDGIHEPCQGTANWIMNTKAYERWCHRDHRSLWLVGDMGSGKSTLAKHLAMSAVQDPKFSFFFNQMHSGPENTPMALLCSLLSAVTTVYTDVDGHSAYDPNPMPSSPRSKTISSVQRAWDVICDCLKTRQFTLIVDGLDECDASGEDFKVMMTHLIAMQHYPNVRVLLSCRPQTRLIPYMASGQQVQLGCDQQQRDVRTFLSTEIQKEVKQQQSLGSLIRDIDSKISTLPVLNFQHIRMFVTHIVGGETISRTRDRIRQFPSGLSQAYQKALNDNGSLDKDAREDRQQFFMLLSGACHPLSINEMRVAHAVKTTRLNPDDLLFRLEERLCAICDPFVRIEDNTASFIHSSVADFFLSDVEPSPIATENLRFSETQLHSYFARKCLITLSMDRYHSTRRIGMLLRYNIDRVSAEQYLKNEHQEVDEFYDYAARNWVNHLEKVPEPDEDLLKLTSNFIGNFCFVHWSEYIIGTSQDMHANDVFRQKNKLEQWREKLKEESKKLLDISKFLEEPYSALSQQYQRSSDDEELPWLCLFRIASYFVLADYFKAYRYLDEVVIGLTALLGREHPMTLRARVEWAKLRGLDETREARDELLEVWEIQREILPSQSPETSVTLQVVGVYSFFLTEFQLAEEQLKQAYGELRNKLGESHYETLCAQLYLGYVSTGLNRDEKALQLLSSVYTLRSQAYGDNDGLSAMSLCARGQGERILDKFGEACKTLQDARAVRVRNWPSTQASVIDTAVHLLIVLRETGQTEEAHRLVNDLDLSFIQKKLFPRYCQIKHLQALLLYDQDYEQAAMHELESLMNEGGRNDYNRGLMWAKLSLAKIKTDQGEEDEAMILFDNIIREKGSNDEEILASEPDSPRILRLARDLVELLRQRRYEEADARLQENNCEWVRERDFWILPGGPMAETAWMKGPWPTLEEVEQ